MRADIGDLVALDRDVADVRGSARAVVNGPATDQDVIVGVVVGLG
jgi:hypothetical protein